MPRCSTSFSSLVHTARVHAEIDEFARAGNAEAPDDIEFGLPEGRGHLVFDHLDPRQGAVRLVLVLEGLDFADIQAHRAVELEGVAACRGFRASVAGHADLHADLVDEDDGRAGFVDGAGEFAQSVGHQARVASNLRFSHGAFQFRLWNKRGDRVDDHKIDSAGSNQHVSDFKRLFSMIGLGDEQFVRFYAKPFGVADVQGVLRINERGRAAHFLTFRDDMQSERGFAGRFRPVDFRNAPLGDAPDAKGQVKADGTCGDHRDIDMHVVGKFHYRTLAKFPLDAVQSGFQGFAAGVLGRNAWLFCHVIKAPCSAVRLCRAAGKMLFLLSFMCFPYQKSLAGATA